MIKMTLTPFDIILIKDVNGWWACAIGPHVSKEGKARKTSPIKFCEGNLIVTESGSIYELGEPSKSYLEQLKVLNLEFKTHQYIPEELWISNINEFLNSSDWYTRLKGTYL